MERLWHGLEEGINQAISMCVYLAVKAQVSALKGGPGLRTRIAAMERFSFIAI